MPANRSSLGSPARPDHPLKIAIPRLYDARSKRKESNDTNRVPRACANCRRRKVKCSAGLPRCRNCEDQNIECVYPTARKDRLQAAKEQNGELIQLLKDLSIRVSDRDKKKISNLLDTVEEEGVVLPSPKSSNTPAKRQRTGKEWPSDLDLEDTDSSTSLSLSEDVGTNDIGRSKRRDSKISGTKREVRRPSRKCPKTSTQHKTLPHPAKSSDPEAIFHVTDWAFYLDNDTFESEVLHPDPLELPVPAEAQRLLDLFMETVHITFPLVTKDSIEESLRKCYNHGNAQRGGNQVTERQKVNLNLMFAIASYHSILKASSDRANYDDHQVYYKRARLLGLNDSDIMTAHPDLPLIQGTGLLALYYLVTGHLSRAWVAIGLSLRFAMAIGLQLPDMEHPTIGEDARARIWWGLRNIEFLLSSGTGRPGVTSDDYCTVPLPQATSKEKDSVAREAPHSNGLLTPNSPTSLDWASLGSFVASYAKIGLITQKVVTQLYSPRSVSKPWENTCPIIISLKSKLDQWALAVLPPPSSVVQRPVGSKVSPKQIQLELYHASTMILITRPCLYHRRRRYNAQNISSQEFDRKMVAKCIESAKRLVALITAHDFGQEWNLDIGPWWSIIHYMMQALTVFLYEISHGSKSLDPMDNQVTDCARKLVYWIRALSDRDGLARDLALKAYEVVLRMLENCHGYESLFLSLPLANDNKSGIESDILYDTRPSPSGSAASYVNALKSTTLEAGCLPFGQQPSEMHLVDDWSWQLPVEFGNVFTDPFASRNPPPQDFSVPFSQEPLDMPSSMPYQQVSPAAPLNFPYQRYPQAGPLGAPHLQVPISNPSTAPPYQEYGNQTKGLHGFVHADQMKQHQYFPH